jgi:hypothetical protein
LSHSHPGVGFNDAHLVAHLHAGTIHATVMDTGILPVESSSVNDLGVCL